MASTSPAALQRHPDFPCSSVQACKIHNPSSHILKIPEPATDKCLITTLPIELLQKIDSDLNDSLSSQAALILTCKTIHLAIGTRSWSTLRRDYGRRRTRERAILLEMLGRDWRDMPGLMFCDVCGIMHVLGRFQGWRLEWEKLEEIEEIKEKESVSFADGAYEVKLRNVRAAVDHRRCGMRRGFCVQLLKCEGEKKLMVEDAIVDEGAELGYLAIEIAHEGQRTLSSLETFAPDYFRRGLHACTWDKSEEVKPKGGGWRAKLCRLGLRLREVRATLQGEEWFFYFPATLLCFLPNSKPFWVLQPASKREIQEGVPRSVPKWLLRRFLSLYWSTMRKEKRDRRGEREESETDENRDGEEDATGWDAYYEDLRATYVVDLVTKPRNDGTTTTSQVAWESRKTFIYYERTLEGKPWYDNVLCWKFHQWWARVTGQRNVDDDISIEARSEEEEGVLEQVEAISSPSPASTSATKMKLNKLLSKAASATRRRQHRAGKKAETKRAIDSSPCNDPLSDADGLDPAIDPGAMSKRPPITRVGQSSSNQAIVSSPSSVPVTDSKIIVLPNVEVPSPPLPASQALNLSYDFCPRVTKNREFILQATYNFTSPTKSSHLLSQIQSSAHKFCPHISTSGKTRYRKPPRPLISEVGTTLYEDRCEFCWTEFEVEVQQAKIGVPKAGKVVFRFWHSFGNGDGDGIWEAAIGSVAYDSDEVEFGRRGIRARWEVAL